MSSIADSRGNYFDIQKEQASDKKHPAQRQNSMDDKEKIVHLKSEIDSLRTQLGLEATGDHLLSSATAAGSSATAAAASAHSAQIFPVFTILFIVSLSVIAMWKKRKTISTRYFRAGSSLPGSNVRMIALELQDSFGASASSQDNNNSNKNDTAPSVAYRAPSAGEISFV